MVIEPCVQVNAIPEVARADFEWGWTDFAEQGFAQTEVARGLLFIEAAHRRERRAGLRDGFLRVHYAGLLAVGGFWMNPYSHCAARRLYLWSMPIPEFCDAGMLRQNRALTVGKTRFSRVALIERGAVERKHALVCAG
jgi:hypothetical protein